MGIFVMQSIILVCKLITLIFNLRFKYFDTKFVISFVKSFQVLILYFFNENR